jgi:UDP-GlcNAc:undecaprenyl-phosphate GlcNAc-1-phosphate transferase
MGDTGSLFLGFNLSVIAVIGLTKTATVISLFLPVVILGIPIMDTLFAIIRRLIANKPIFCPDKEHLHHRLLSLGLSHKNTVLAIYGVSVILGASAVVMSRITPAPGMLIMIAITLGFFIGAERLGILNNRHIPQQVSQRQPQQQPQHQNGSEKKAFNHIAK